MLKLRFREVGQRAPRESGLAAAAAKTQRHLFMAAPFAPAGGGGRPDVLWGLSLKQKPLFPCATHFLKAIFPHNAARIGGNGNLNFHLLMACSTLGSGSYLTDTLSPSRQQHPLGLQNATIFGNRMFKEVIKIKWGHTGSPQTSTSL